MQEILYLYKCYFGLGQIESQIKCRLCKDDSRLKSLEICFLRQF